MDCKIFYNLKYDELYFQFSEKDGLYKVMQILSTSWVPIILYMDKIAITTFTKIENTQKLNYSLLKDVAKNLLNYRNTLYIHKTKKTKNLLINYYPNLYIEFEYNNEHRILRLKTPKIENLIKIIDTDIYKKLTVLEQDNLIQLLFIDDQFPIALQILNL